MNCFAALKLACAPLGAFFSAGAAAAGKRSRNSKWDDKSAASCATEWGKKWRTILQDVLPGAEAATRADSDPEVQKLCMVLWKDIVSWVGEDFLRHLRLFQASDAGRAGKKHALVSGTASYSCC